MRTALYVIFLLIMVSACAEAPVPGSGTPTAQPAALNPSTAEPPVSAALDDKPEVARLRAALMREVPSVIIDKSEREQAWITETKAAIAAGGPTIDRPQLLVVVDRNPDVQQMRIVLAAPKWGVGEPRRQQSIDRPDRPPRLLPNADRRFPAHRCDPRLARRRHI